jgi:predicted SPOUT superfamily RNA methylase MTH1
LGFGSIVTVGLRYCFAQGVRFLGHVWLKTCMIIVKPSRVTVALPFTSIWFGSHLREKTFRAANLLRYASIFRVRRILVLLDGGDRRARRELREIFEYLLLPPYLKADVALKPHLRYVGLAPPIKTPLHTVSGDPSSAMAEPLRMARVIDVGGGKTWLKAGFNKTTTAPLKPTLKRGDYVYVKVTGQSGDTVFTDFVWPTPSTLYLEPQVNFVGLNQVESHLAPESLKIELTRNGDPPHLLASESSNMELVFFVGNQHADPEEFLRVHFNFKIRLLPEQGVETIRSEEALLIALAQTAWYTG